MNAALAKGVMFVSVLALFWMALSVCVRYPDNHGAGPAQFQYLFIAVLLIAAILSIWRSRFAFAAMGLSLLGLFLTWLVDRRNIMVDYDEWTTRGMPGWGEVDSSRPASQEKRSSDDW